MVVVVVTCLARCACLALGDPPSVTASASPSLDALQVCTYAFQGMAGDLLPGAFGVEAEVEELMALQQEAAHGFG